MRLYWPESGGIAMDCVGYNHAVMLLRKALAAYIVEDPRDANVRVYCNIPWYNNPSELQVDGLPLLVYTMYESTRVPREWVEFLNRHAAVTVVPSEWCRKIFRESGVRTPLFVVSLGVDFDTIEPALKMSCKGDPYIFFWQGVAYDPQGRKGVDVVVQAFTELKAEGLLQDRDELVLKFRPYRERKFEMDDVRSPIGIRYIQKEMTRKDLIKLYASVDCCVNPTHGEGFGLIPLEQMAMGKPVLVTNYSMPYIDESVCIPLQYTLAKSPVVWNHHHVVVSKNGMSFNLSGLQTEVKWMPKKLALKPTREYQIITAEGFQTVTPSFRDVVLNSINNGLARVQRKTGLYWTTHGTPLVLYQEYPGEDAHVKVQHLKEKMVWCYNNRERAEDMGFLAREYVRRHWTLDRIQVEFELFAERVKELQLWRN